MGKVINPNIRFHLKEFRLEHELKQSDIAELFGIQQCSVSLIESSARNLSEYQYKQLYDKYGEDEVNKYKETIESSVTYNISKGSIIGNGNTDNQVKYEASDSLSLKKVISTQAKTIESLTKEIEAKQRTIDSLLKTIENLSKNIQ